jgi:fructose-bisphosphate aldolase class II
MTAAIRKQFGDNPDAFDPRGYLGAAREAIQTLVEAKIANVLGSENSMH